MEDVFKTEAAPEAEVIVEDAKSKKKTKATEMKEMMKTAISEDPTLVSRLRNLSNSLEVVNTLGFSGRQNIKVDKEKSTEGDRVLVNTSYICGYRVRNCGETPIKYQTEVYTKDADGVYKGEVVEKTLSPGETADLTRQYMTIMCSRSEISFTLKNGKIVASSASSKNKKTLKEELESFYFKFEPGADGEKINVNDDDVKLAIDTVDADGTITIKPEYEATFGFLVNPKKKKQSSAGTGITTQDVTANWVKQKLLKSGVIG